MLTPRKTPQRKRVEYVDIDADPDSPQAGSSQTPQREPFGNLGDDFIQDYFHDTPEVQAALLQQSGMPLQRRRLSLGGRTLANGRSVPTRAPPRPSKTPTPKKRGRPSNTALTPDESRTAPQLNPVDANSENIIFPPNQDKGARPLLLCEVRETLMTMFTMPTNSNELDADNIDPAKTRVEGFDDSFSLKPHQITAREWMKDREDVEHKHKGGILADDMGLGKTVQMVVRIYDDKMARSRSDKNDYPTLVVCPVSLLTHWSNEIKQLTEDLDVLIYHGNTRHVIDIKTLKAKDVVITTYDVVRSEHDHHTTQARHEGQVQLLTPLTPSRKYHTTRFKSKRSKRDDSDWEPLDSDDTAESSDSSSDDELPIDLDDMMDIDEKPAQRKRKKVKGLKLPVVKDGLFQVKWHRIVLDEASHKIKNHKSKTARACTSLQTTFRWCLTGTPLHNSVYDIHSLLIFLNISPFKDTAWFRENIAHPLETGHKAKVALNKLHFLLSKTMIRRLKTQLINGQPIVDLPEKNFQLVSLSMKEDERQFYLCMESRLRAKVERLVANQSKGGGSAAQKAWAFRSSVYILLLRLRQACDHPSLILKEHKDDKFAILPAEEVEERGQIPVEPSCRICCRQPLPKENNFCIDCHDAVVSRSFSFKNKRTTKVTAILNLLDEIAKTKTSPTHCNDIKTESSKSLNKGKQPAEVTRDKVVIYSQFTSMLDLLEPYLGGKRFKYVRYDGKMDLKMRDEALEQIRTNPEATIILVSLMAGGAGLNLTACNHLILVDPWWNPAIEDQAFDRVHRISQGKPVKIYKLIINDTVEGRILALQRKKTLLAKAALSKEGIENVQKMTTEELVSLFGASDTSPPAEGNSQHRTALS